MYKEMFKFVENTLQKNNGIKSKNIHHQFRNRFEHTKRVYKWLERILPDYPNCDFEVAKIAAIFHDIGYGGEDFKSHHGEKGAQIFLNYAKDIDLKECQKEQIANIIKNHSNKNLIFDQSSSEEMILVLEADLLDEEGVLGIAFDLMSAGAKEPKSYRDGLSEIMFHSAHILRQNPMKTPLAIKYWEEKKEIVNNFVNSYLDDLD